MHSNFRTKSKKTIKSYSHPEEAGQGQILSALDRTTEQVLEYLESSKLGHRQMHGETEKERLTKGKRIIFCKLANY